MTTGATIAKGSFWILSSAIMTKLISFIYTIIIARLLLPDEIGSFYLALSIIGILYIFTDLGLIYSLSRYVPYLYGREEFGKLRKLVKLCYLGGGALTFIFSVIVFLLSGFMAQMVGQPAVAPLLQILSVWLLVKEMDEVSRGILNGRKRMRETQGLDVVQNFVKLVLTVIAFYVLGFNAAALSAGFLLSFMVIVPPGAYFAWQEIKTWKKDEIRQTTAEQISLGKEVVTFGLVVTLIASLWTVIQYTDRIMLGYLAEDALNKIAVYSIALGLANLILIFPSGISGIFFPVVSELFGKNDINEMNRILKTSMKWTAILMVPLALIMGVFADSLLMLFYGETYGQGAIVLVLFIAGLFIRSLFYLPQLILSAMRRLDVELKAAGAAAVANVILNFLLIPMLGIDGAALASMLSFAIVSAMIFYYSTRIFAFTFPKETYKPLLGGMAALAVILFMKEHIIILMNNYVSFIQIGASAGQISDEIMQQLVKLAIFGLLFLFSVLVYLIALLLLKSFGEEEITLLEAGLRRARVPEKYVSWSRIFLEAKWLRLQR